MRKPSILDETEQKQEDDQKLDQIFGIFTTVPSSDVSPSQ